ncbi:MAG: hypothetical protein WCT12_24180 [Verrucomicrobiota bacterium]
MKPRFSRRLSVSLKPLRESSQAMGAWWSSRKMSLEWPADIVIYRYRLNAKINRNFEVFTATEDCRRRWFRIARAFRRHHRG